MTKAEYVFNKLAQNSWAGVDTLKTTSGKPQLNAWAINQVKTPQGPRYYKSVIPKVYDTGFGRSQALFDAQNKFFTNKADSIPTPEVNKFLSDRNIKKK